MGRLGLVFYLVVKSITSVFRGLSAMWLVRSRTSVCVFARDGEETQRGIETEITYMIIFCVSK